MKVRSKRIVAVIIIFLVVGSFSYFLFPVQLFEEDYATVLKDHEGYLLGAKIAKDEQWRFPPLDSVPEKFKQAVLHFEDRFFYYHPGFNPASLIRAAYWNIKYGEIISGGSTLTMQLVRLSRKGKSRTYLEKLIEIILATRLEIAYSKEEILNMYASHAPFGGNVVGLEAASWKYFGRTANQLSWGESALLAVLPNSPGLIYPGKNQILLKRKRDFLLDKLNAYEIIDSTTAYLAKNEPLPGLPRPVPQIASHLLIRSLKEGSVVNSTIDYHLQKNINRIIADHNEKNLKGNEIHNAAAIVAKIDDGTVLAYVGNTANEGSDEYGNKVDIISSERSTGSILKPFLYAAMLHEGSLLPGELIPDIPTIIDGFAPKNFSKTYDGAVPAKKALARSLNIPAVYMLQDYGYEKFHHFLQKAGMNTLHFPPSHYGLSLVLGGAEATLWDLTGIYASLGRCLKNYFKYPEPDRYADTDFHPLVYEKSNGYSGQVNNLNNNPFIHASAIWHTLDAMLDVNRPPEESSWELFSSSKKIAWKTGTSYGFRDAWAIGLNTEYIVGIWVGNADGEGRPGIVGLKAAAPILFDVFSLLPDAEWYDKPLSDMASVAVCKQSGLKATELCYPVDTIAIPIAGLRAKSCPYHQLIHLDSSENYRVHSACESVNTMIHKSWFILPPVQEWFYRRRNAGYRVLPPFRNDCEHAKQIPSMQMIYPKTGAQIYVPRELNGDPGRAIFEVAHRDPASIIYWHLDHQYLGYTKRMHQMDLYPVAGNHRLTLVDEKGEELKVNFKVMSQ